jgi:hypothetical protein
MEIRDDPCAFYEGLLVVEADTSISQDLIVGIHQYLVRSYYWQVQLVHDSTSL